MDEFKEHNRLLRAEDIAELLKISMTHAYRLMQTGVIPSVRFGGVVRVRAIDLQDFIDRKTQNNIIKIDPEIVEE